VAHGRIFVRLSAALACGDELLCCPRHRGHGDATGVDGDRTRAADQCGADSRVAVEGHCGGLCTAGNRAMGPEARPVWWPIGPLFGPACGKICGTCAGWSRAEKLPKNSTAFIAGYRY